SSASTAESSTVASTSFCALVALTGSLLDGRVGSIVAQIASCPLPLPSVFLVGILVNPWRTTPPLKFPVLKRGDTRWDHRRRPRRPRPRSPPAPQLPTCPPRHPAIRLAGPRARPAGPAERA